MTIRRRVCCSAPTDRILLPTSITLALILASFLPSTEASPIKCGNPLTTPCVSWYDKRYDPSQSNSLPSQNKLWASTAGTWTASTLQVDSNGNPRQPTHYDPTTGKGLPYRSDSVIIFKKQIVIGSRLYVRGIKVYQPAPKIFCMISNLPGYNPSNPYATNVIGQGTCGDHGYVSYFEYFGTATPERDGKVNIFWYNDDTYSGPADANSAAHPIGNDTVYYRISKPGSMESSSRMEIFVSDNVDRIGGTGTDLVTEVPSGVTRSNNHQSGLVDMTHSFYNATRADETDWKEKIRLAYEHANILSGEHIDPTVNGGCLSRIGRCPTEEEFCTLGKDPECSPSPYQEPEAGVKLIPVVCFSAIFLLALIFSGIIIHRMILQNKLSKHEMDKDLDKMLNHLEDLTV